MKAVQVLNYGGPEVAKVKTIEKPLRKKGEVLVNVVASSINPVDIGFMTPNTMPKINQFPAVLGWDMTGIVVETDPNQVFEIGDRVAAMYPQGSWQQVISIPEKQLVKLPDDIDFVSGASIPLASVTALQALQKLQLNAEQSLLVTGAAGSVGRFAIQFAKEKGIFVSGLVRNDKQKKSLYSLSKNVYVVDEKIPSFDAVLDTAGILDRTDFLKINGKVVTVNTADISPEVEHHSSFAERHQVRTNAKDLAHILSLVSAGKIETNVFKSYSMYEIKKALNQAMQHGNDGKIVLTF
ncbi:NADP-dependent oxidoreductase [Tetragenococcus solitarius]|uniref:NADP-dependent oxidoreductase n=1 Tax=Tetragenococcus solitarius TaxID=71453 RepID=A0ABN3Y4K9_9ENTE|nr:NADP-dependent oxidoreductase [Tetragenococcus solitarius]